MYELELQKKKTNQKTLIITVCTLVCFPPIVLFVNMLCSAIFGPDFSMDTLACYFFAACMILFSLKELHFRIKIDALLIYVVFILAYIISYAFFEANRRYLVTEWDDFASNPVYLLFVFSLPAYVFMRYINDYERLYKTFFYFALIVVFCSLGTFVLMLVDDDQPEYMSFSYNLLFSIIFLAIYFFEKKNVLALLAAILGIGMILFAGARGPLVCFLAALVAYLMLKKDSSVKKIIVLIFLGIAILIIALFWEQILLMLSDFATELGVSSRTIELLLNGEFSSDSGRWEIQKKIIDGFTPLGKGLFGDRVLGENHYAHNLIIELISQWGYFLGTIIVVGLGVLFVNGFRTKDKTAQLIILTLFTSSILKLMLSNSYLSHNSSFFVLIAVCVNSIENPSGKVDDAGEDPPTFQSRYIKTRIR